VSRIEYIVLDDVTFSLPLFSCNVFRRAKVGKRLASLLFIVVFALDRRLHDTDVITSVPIGL